MLVGLLQAQALLVLVMLPFTWTASIANSGVSDVSDSETSMMADTFDSPQDADIQADRRHRRGLLFDEKCDSDLDRNGETCEAFPKLQETNFVWTVSGFKEKLAACRKDPAVYVQSDTFSVGDGYYFRAAAFLNGEGGDEHILFALLGKGMCQKRQSWLQEMGSKFELTVFLMDQTPGRKKHVVRDIFPYFFHRPSSQVPANTKSDKFAAIHMFYGFYPVANLSESGYLVDDSLVFKVVARPAKTADYFQSKSFFSRILSKIPSSFFPNPLSYVPTPFRQCSERLAQGISSCPDGYLKWTMVGFKQQQKLAVDGGPLYTFSPTFSYQNYKLILRVFPNGFKKGTNTHLSVSVHVMNDKYDPHHPWPLPSEVTVKLLKKNHGHQDNAFSKTLTADKIKEVLRWPLPNAIMSSGLEVTDFISFEVLEKPSLGYLDEFIDSLTFEVVVGPPLNTDTVSTNGVFEWKISGFTHKREEAVSREQLAIYSPAFYSKEGYKFTVGAQLNGLRLGYNTHISVYLYVMAGEHDARLAWPFKGRVTFMLFDNKKDKPVHWLKGFTADETAATFQKPAEGVSMNWQKRSLVEFFPLEQLSMSDYINIVDDTLTLKIAVQPPLSRDTFQDLASEDGTLVWQIGNFTRKQSDAQSYEIYSPAFYADQYKLAVFLYPNGYGNGTGSHLSIDMRIVSDESGHLNTCPFQGKVKIIVVHPTDSDQHVVVSDNNLELQTPEEGAVVGPSKSWPEVLPLADLREMGFLSCDTLTIKVSVSSHEPDEPELFFSPF